MHQSIKKLFRLFWAICIFLITLALVVTCGVIAKELLTTQQNIQNKHILKFESSPSQQYILMSNNKKPDQQALIVLKNQGYISKIKCEHYLTDICTDHENLLANRNIQHATLEKIGRYQYFQEIQWQDNQTGEINRLNWSPAQIHNFYQTDMTSLKYTLLALCIFAAIGLYCCYRLIRNFKKFLNN